MNRSKEQTRFTNPLEVAPLPSLLTFGHTLDLFSKGYNRDLETEDLYNVLKSCKSKTCGDQAEKKWNITNSLLKLLASQFGLQYFFICVISICWTQIDSILSPLGLSRLVAYFTPNQISITKNDAYQYAAILIILKCCNFMVSGNLHLWQNILGVQIQTSLKSLLYRKSLKLSSISAGAILGNLITIITKDIRTVEHNLWILKDFVKCGIQFITISYLMWRRMGNPAFIGLGLIFGAFPLQVYLSAKLKNMRIKVGRSSDKRLQRMQETLSAIKIIKMYVWEDFFYSRIENSRKEEINELAKVFFVNFTIVTLGMVVSKITFLVLMVSYLWLGYETNAEFIFYILSLFNQLTRAVSLTLPRNFSRSANFWASFQRLEAILSADEVEETSTEYSEKPSIMLRGVSLSINHKKILDRISLSVNEPGLTVVTGPVGSGKSVLLKVMLKEIKAEGSIKIEGDISYASQEPWLFPGTIRDNILFGEKYEKTRYEEVLRICALEYDFSVFDEGDQTVLADNGQNLSKGQQTRINLARAVYKMSNIYLLDDPLAALDNHVRVFIFNHCILNFLADKVCIMVSHNPQHMERACNVIYLNEGQVECGKNSIILKQSTNNETSNYTVGTVTSSRHVQDEKKLVLHETEQQQNRRSVYNEMKKSGKVRFDIYKKYCQHGGGANWMIVIFSLFVFAQVCDGYAEKMLTKWVDLQQKVFDIRNNNTGNDINYDEAMSAKDRTFYTYSILTILRSVMILVKFGSLLLFCRNASLKLHEAMSSRVIGATMSFFDQYYIGNILNRFSYDLNNIDEFLPFLFPFLGSTIFGALGSLYLIITVNWFFLLPAFTFMVSLLVMRVVLVPTARSLKRLEAATRSPVVGHMNTSLEGLATIRAFNAEQTFKKEFDRHQDMFTSASLSLQNAMTAFGFYMDAMSALLTALVVIRMLFFERNASAGTVGLALSQVIMFTHMLEAAIRVWSELENNMTSVERAIEYSEIGQENKVGRKIAGWPSMGAIRFKNVSLCYEGSRTEILKGISFNVESGKKIGIVGRTGAGKSSIISVLYRLYDFRGTVHIDGVDIKSVPLDFLRKNMAIIPQQPILFVGTVRQNIDPERKYSDAVIDEVIKKIGINEFVSSLDTIVEDINSTYSSGQKQMICLARAAVSRCKILVLDEATANMDAETDEKLHEIINELFSDCTVLSITHRLNSISNYDEVLVLDNGNIVEFNTPKILLEDDNSLLHKMYQENGMND